MPISVGDSRSFRNAIDSSENPFIAIGLIKEKPLNFREDNFSKETDTKRSSYLADAARGDIMTQSLRRQTRRNSKPNLTDLATGALEPNSGMMIRGPSPDKFMMFNPDDARFAFSDANERNRETRRSKKSLQNNQTSNHEDVQVLNLQGFMDNSLTTSNTLEPKKKSKRRRAKRLDDNTPGDISHQNSRRKRYSRSKGRAAVDNYDEDDDVALRDLDELDDEMSGLVLGPKVIAKENSGAPITLESASELRKILTGNLVSPLPHEWMTQNFQANSRQNLPYGLVQKKVRVVYKLGMYYLLQTYFLHS